MAYLGHVTYFSNFGTLNIWILERVKVKASNFALGLKVRDRILNKICKTGQTSRDLQGGPKSKPINSLHL